MPKRELEAVLAHEVAHIRNRDTYLMTMALVFAGVIALIADIGFRSHRLRRTAAEGGVIVARGRARRLPACAVRRTAPAAEPVPRAGSSSRTQASAEILNDPEAMALALRRLERDSTTVRYAEASTAHLWVESPTDRRRLRAVGRPGALEPVQHAPPDRGAHLGARGGRGIPTAEQLPVGRAVRHRAAGPRPSALVGRPEAPDRRIG